MRIRLGLLLIFFMFASAFANFAHDLSFNGKFYPVPVNDNCEAQSPNGMFWADYSIGQAGDEIREIINFRFYENNRLVYTLGKTPGSDLYISNTGITVFLDHTYHYRDELKILFFSESGEKLFSKKFIGAYLFGFSPDGSKFGVSTPDGLNVISLNDQKTTIYPKGFQFSFSDGGQLIAIAMENKIELYSQDNLTQVFDTGFDYTRKIAISADNNYVAAIDKRNLKLYSTQTGEILFVKSLSGDFSFRDLIIEDQTIKTGIHFRNSEISRGILYEYNFEGDLISDSIIATKLINQTKKPAKPLTEYDPIPWPFAPFDSVCTVWNHYEQHMGGYGPDFSYLHQGLDIITPIDDPTYAVQSGVVKLVLTLGGASYWRIAVSPEQNSGISSGWLYAHLVENSIQFDVGDTISIYDYLGDIIYWAEDYGHIHFVEITDSGLVWRYDDNEWGINFNPLLALTPYADTLAPYFEDVFDNEKFAFCENEISSYLDPDSLFGDIDIIAKVVDYSINSNWQLPAYETFYWVKSFPDTLTVFPRTLGHILNHSYDFYNSNGYEPYATLMYKRDEILEPSSWVDTLRNYHHILTNSNGDSLGELWEKNLAFATANYPDGDYRIFIEARDEAGNIGLDSMDVRFVNGNVGIDDNSGLPVSFKLLGNYPNPFNPSTVIKYQLAEKSYVTLTIYNLLGKKISDIVNQTQSAGFHSVVFESNGLPSGVYFYRLTIDNNSQSSKMVLIR